MKLKLNSGAAKILMAGLLLGPCSTLATAAPVETTWFRITQITGGWNSPAFFIVPSASVNPAGCQYGDQYMIDPALSGATLFDNMAISAFTAGRESKVVLDGCTGGGTSGWPKVISIIVH